MEVGDEVKHTKVGNQWLKVFTITQLLQSLLVRRSLTFTWRDQLNKIGEDLKEKGVASKNEGQSKSLGSEGRDTLCV